MKKIYFLATIIAAALAVTSCSGVKHCAPPSLEIPSTIVKGYNDSLTIADVEWWEFYSDPALRRLIEEALANNRNLLAAAAGVEEARLLYGAAKADQLPQIGFTAGGNNETNDYYGEKHINDPEYSLKATLSWEVDFWGRLKWAKDKGEHAYLESVEAKRAMQMTLIAEVATAYFRLVALDNELAIVRRTLTTRMEGVKQAKLRFEGGLTSEMVYQQAQVEYATAATLVPSLERQIETTMSALSVLTGSFPGEKITRTKIDVETFLPDSVDIGLPSTLLTRRPDLRAAEQRLQAAMSSVGIAYADRFPRLNISLIGGLENDGLSHFFESPFSYISAVVAGPLIDFGRRKKRYEASIAAYDRARLAYEQKVLEVFRETGDAVTTYRNAVATARLRATLRDAAMKYVNLAHIQYRAGSISYLDVLDAQRRYFDAQIGLSNAVRDENLALVGLYKALGGGW